MVANVLRGANQPDDNVAPALLAATGTVTAVAILAMCARLWVRVVMIRQVGWDDWLMVSAMVMSVVGLGIVIAEADYGAGRHAAYLEPARESYGLKLNFVSQLIYLIGVVLVKMSIGVFLLRLTPSTFFRRFIWGMQIFMGLYTLAAFITIFVNCRPLGVLWKDPSVTTFTCFAPDTARACAYLNGALSIFADLVMALVPIPMLWKVQMDRQIKLALIGVLSLGFFSVTACIVKVSYLPSYGQYGDFLWDSVNLTIWTATEQNIGILAGSIPCLHPLLKAVFQGSAYGSSYLQSREERSKSFSAYSDTTTTRKLSKVSTHKTAGMDIEDGFEMYASPMEAYRNKGVKISSGVDVNNVSEERILSSQGQDHGGIMKTTEFFVTSDEIRSKAERVVEDRV